MLAELAPDNPSCSAIKELLASTTTIAVVGCSQKPYRESHTISKALNRRGFRMIPVNPEYEGELWGEKIYPTLEAIPDPVDIVNVYRRPEFTEDIARQAVEIGARALWLQLGIRNENAARIAREGGLLVVQDLCLAVAHTMLLAR